MESLEKLRQLFEKRLAEGIPTPPGEFYPQDLERLKDDQYLTRVLEHCSGDVERSSKMLWSIMKWRKIIEANEISESNMNMDYVNEGTIFPHGRDLDGCRLVIVKCKNYIKGQKNFDDVKKIIVYWFDRVEREENGRKITLFFDMDNCGLSNLDIELIRFMITLFSMYYPMFLQHIVVYQLPWVLTAAFKMVKRLLPPEAVALMKFVSKDNVLKEVVSPENALKCWGGRDDYVFQFVPEKKVNKKVTFAETQENRLSLISTISNDDSENGEDYTDGLERSRNDVTNYTNGVEQFANEAEISTNPVEVTTNPAKSAKVSKNPIQIVQIKPDRIIFKMEDQELRSDIKIKNLNETRAAFKIRTTGPEKFWVRPTSGILGANETKNIIITVLPAYEKTAAKEKFLVMAKSVTTEINDADLVGIWKNAPKKDIEEHKIRCYVEEKKTISVDYDTNMMPKPKEVVIKQETTKDLQELKEDINALKVQMEKMKFYQFISVILGFVTVLLACIIYKELPAINEEIKQEL